jgi:hypothetical protein
MPETENHSPAKIVAKPVAILLGAILLFGYAVISIYAIYERLHRTSVEHVSYGYAVGDTNYFPKSFDASVPVVNYSGHSLYYVNHREALDSSMARVGMDDSNVYTIYKFTEAPPNEAGSLYLKVGPNYFMQVKQP